MESTLEQHGFELLCIIVNFGLGTRIVKSAKNQGITGATVFLGKGTVKNRVLEFLELYDIRKEIVLMVAEKNLAHATLENLNHEFKFCKPNHGIAFMTSLTRFLGSKNFNLNSIEESRGANGKMYQAIFTVVDKGKAHEVIDVATQAGSKGGTIINARGSGIHETAKLFSMEIEPEKEIVLILTEIALTDGIVSAIRKELKIDEPGTGIIFVQDISMTYGLA